MSIDLTPFVVFIANNSLKPPYYTLATILQLFCYLKKVLHLLNYLATQLHSNIKSVNPFIYNIL